MRNTLTAVFISSLLITSPVMADAGHEHYHEHDHGSGSHSHGAMPGEIAIEKATAKVKSFIESGKLDKSWADVKASSATQKTSEGYAEWVVVFKNAKISDQSKQTLYVFFSLYGMYIATNYSGN